MADDIMGLLASSYNSVSSSQETDRETIKKMFPELPLNGDGNIRSTGLAYKEEIKLSEQIRKAEMNRYKEIYKQELELHKYSTTLKADLLKQESKHYNDIFNMRNDLHTKTVTLLEEERDIRAEIAKSGKASLGDLAALYTKRRQLEELEKQSLEYKEQQFKKGVDNVKQAFRTITDHVLRYVNERSNLLRWNQWESGIKNLGSAYEERFTEIAARTGSSSQIDTHNLIGGGLDKILADSELAKGLNFNSEVFPAITEAVQKGFMDEEAIEIAIDNAIDKKVAPWLDTSSETWVNLQYQLSDDMLAQLKGQQLLLQETREGNRILQNGVVSALLDELAPTLLNIDANTTDVTDLSGQAQQMVASLMANGYSKQDAVKVANQTIDAYQNPFNNLTGSSSTWQKLLAIGGLQGNDLASAMDFATGAISPFNNGHWAAGGAVAANLGVPTNGFTRNTNYIEDLLNASKAANDYSKRGDLSTVYNMKVANINELTTATQQNDNLAQNKAAQDVYDKNLIAHGIDLAALQLNELKEIKTWIITGLTAWAIGKLTDKLTDGFVDKFLSKFKGGGTGGSGGSGGSSGGGLKGLTKGGLNSKLSGGALIAGGLIEGYQGIKAIDEGINIKNDKTANDIEKSKANVDIATGAVAAGAGATAAVAGGLVMAGVSAGPVGWAALAIGGLALGAKALNDHFAALSDGSAQISANFDQARQSIELERQSREDQLLAIKDNLDEYDTTTEKLQYLQQNGINVNEQALKDVNGQLDIYLNNLIKANDTDAATAENMLTDIEAKLKNDTNQNLDDIKQAILDNYSAEQIAKDNGLDVKKDADKVWNLQKTALKKAGYTDSELSSLYYHWNNGAAGKDELKDFLNSGAVQGDNIGSFEDHYEKGKIKASGVNYLLEQSGYNNISMIDYNEISSELGPYAQKIATLKRWKDNKNSADYNQEIYDQYKQDILNLPKDYKSSLTYMFESIGEKNAMSDWPNSLKGFRLGSTYIPYDMLAMVHAGERVLTAGQNKEYTQELVSGNSASSIIQAGIQDIVIAIKTQTSEIINYLSTMSFNNSSFGSSHINMLPAMGNTKVTL